MYTSIFVRNSCGCLSPLPLSYSQISAVHTQTLSAPPLCASRQSRDVVPPSSGLFRDDSTPCLVFVVIFSADRTNREKYDIQSWYVHIMTLSYCQQHARFSPPPSLRPCPTSSLVLTPLYRGGGGRQRPISMCGSNGNLISLCVMGTYVIMLIDPST